MGSVLRPRSSSFISDGGIRGLLRRTLSCYYFFFFAAFFFAAFFFAGNLRAPLSSRRGCHRINIALPGVGPFRHGTLISGRTASLATLARTREKSNRTMPHLTLFFPQRYEKNFRARFFSMSRGERIFADARSASLNRAN